MTLNRLTMHQATLAPNQTDNIDPQTELEKNVKISNSNQDAGQIKVKSPNVDAVTYDIAAKGQKNLLIPIGETTFTNIGLLKQLQK